LNNSKPLIPKLPLKVPAGNSGKGGTGKPKRRGLKIGTGGALREVLGSNP